jgi:GNAT superfamily N-acetyltransferase
MRLRIVRPTSISCRWFSPSAGLTFWHVNVLFWVVFGACVFVVRLLINRDIFHAVGFTLFSETLAFGLSLVLRPFYRRLPFEIRTAVVVALLSLFAGILLAALSYWFSNVTGWRSPYFSHLENFMARVILMWMVFLGWSFGYFWLKTEAALRDETRFAVEAVEEAHRMELQMLRAQLDPHFLFNALNGIVAEIRPHPQTATEMVRELSDYLRYSLDHRKRVLSPLSDELDAMKAYLEIEMARFGDRLHVEFHVTEAARWRQVPSFLLQPLVENAIKHGLLDTRHPMRLVLTADVQDQVLKVDVANSGHLAPGLPVRSGLGLDTLRRRLELHYPGRHRFDLEENDGTVHATLELRGEPCCA